MSSLKNKSYIAGSQNLTTRYGGVPVIYVESEEDYYVFRDCWFKQFLSQVEFKPALDKAKLAGCGGVIEAVTNELANGNAAWGIVDRDTTLTHELWHLVDETDDTKFDSAKPFGQTIKVLKLWEMESYLVDTEALEHHRAAIKKQPPRAIADVNQELLNHCDTLVPHAALNAILHAKKTKGLGDGYTDRFNSREEVEAEISSTMVPSLSPSEQAEFISTKVKIDAFGDNAKTHRERVDSLLRRIYGKAVLSRFKSQHKINVDLDGLLAKRIEEQNRVPTEISEFVSSVCARV